MQQPIVAIPFCFIFSFDIVMNDGTEGRATDLLLLRAKSICSHAIYCLGALNVSRQGLQP
jgi:hypothetical protein